MVWADGPLKTTFDGIKFSPIPKENLPEEIQKGGSENIYLRPENPQDTVYYRILSVSGADQTTAISESDVKVERTEVNGVKDYKPIVLTEDLVDADGHFIVKAARKSQDGAWSEGVTMTYNVVFGEHTSATILAFENNTEPTQFMVGESYVMQFSLTAPDDSLARYGSTKVNLIMNNTMTGIDWANVEYKFAENDEWVAVDEDDLDELIRIPNTFKNFVEKGVWVRVSLVRNKRSDVMDLMICITRGNSFLDASALSSVLNPQISCVDRPATAPAFSPAAGYITKGSSVTM
ncbi:MAG: hypothetical protein K2H65_00705, partial [Bacteroidales bacterium]|nr:hypothetical protein [Bacteroidales bacterium]